MSVAENKNKIWSKEEDDYLKQNYSESIISDLSKKLKRSESSIKARAVMLGVTVRKNHCWSDSDDELLRKYYPIGGYELCRTKGLKLTQSAIINRAYKLGIKRDTSNTYWSDEDIETLKNNYSNISISDLAKLLNRSEASIRCKAIFLGYKIANYWTEEEDAILKEHYLTSTYEELLELGLKGRTKSAINSRVYYLGLGCKVKSNWTSSELELLEKYYWRYTIPELQAMGINKSKSAIAYKANKLNLRKIPTNK